MRLRKTYWGALRLPSLFVEELSDDLRQQGKAPLQAVPPKHGELPLSKAAAKIVEEAMELSTKRGKEPVRALHVLLAILSQDDDLSRAIQRHGLTESAVDRALKARWSMHGRDVPPGGATVRTEWVLRSEGFGRSADLRAPESARLAKGSRRDRRELLCRGQNAVADRSATDNFRR